MWVFTYIFSHAEFSCLICRQVMTFPITTPCAHNFCKSCLEGAFAGKTFVRERSRNGRSLRSQKNVMCCPSCPTDISDFLENPQVCHVLAYLLFIFAKWILFVLYFVLPQSYIVGPVKNPNSNGRGGIDFLLFFQIKEGMNFWENGRRVSTCVLLKEHYGLNYCWKVHDLVLSSKQPNEALVTS